MRKVCVLLSTYNGVEYVAQQIDTLLGQQGVQIEIIARDDGSTDGTRGILQRYEEGSDCFHWYAGSNVGPSNSFFDLIRAAPNADYYAFCDQDDVWDSDKLETATAALDKLDEEVPNCYFSNLRIVDKDLNYYRESHDAPLVQNNKYSALVEDMATGCTMVFNKKAADLVRAHIPVKCSMHDSWVYLTCKFFGETVYDFGSHISYRQHGDNVVGTYLDKKTINIYLSRIKRLFNRKLQPRYSNACSFMDEYGEMMTATDKVQVEKIVRYKTSLLNRVRLIFDRDIYATSRGRDVRFRLLVALGIV